MAQELGRISRPSSAQYEGRRKLLLVPLIYGPPGDAADGVEVLQKYWSEVQIQVQSLQSALGGLHHVYHESLSEGGQQGLDLLGQADQRSHEFVKSKCDSGAVLEITEDAASLMETIDLQRCLMMPLASEAVPTRLHEWHAEANKSRYEHIASNIDSTLGENELGLLLVSERHQIQFPADIEVFYVSPPALDEFRRWLQNWSAKQQAQAAESEPTESDEEFGDQPVVDEVAADDPTADDPTTEEQSETDPSVSEAEEEA